MVSLQDCSSCCNILTLLDFWVSSQSDSLQCIEGCELEENCANFACEVGLNFREGEDSGFQVDANGVEVTYTCADGGIVEQFLSFTPTQFPTMFPTLFPTELETANPTAIPTAFPTNFPTQIPSEAPTAEETAFPTNFPTQIPSEAPTAEETAFPTQFPSQSPTAIPTNIPTAFPTNFPTAAPSEGPSVDQTAFPTQFPSESPTPIPTVDPTAFPTNFPSAEPSVAPTSFPSQTPTAEPTAEPTSFPTAFPSETDALIAPLPAENDATAVIAPKGRGRSRGAAGITSAAAIIPLIAVILIVFVGAYCYEKGYIPWFQKDEEKSQNQK